MNFIRKQEYSYVMIILDLSIAESYKNTFVNKQKLSALGIEFEEDDDHVVVNGVTFNKPFVEKPVDAEVIIRVTYHKEIFKY